MRKIQAAVFDLDGTLLNTLDDLADSTNRVLAGMGFPTHPAEKYKYFVGDGIEKLAWRVLPENTRNEATVSLCVSKILKEYGTHWKNKTKLYDGIAELLSALAEKKIRLTILSNKPDHLTREAHLFFLNKWDFDIVCGATEHIAKKPDPAGALEIARLLHIPCENFLYLGDTGIDMETASRARMFGIGALWGFRTSDELIRNGALALAQSPIDVLKFI